VKKPVVDAVKVNTSGTRRLRLRVIAKLMGLSSTTLKVSLADLEPGMMKRLVWEARPVLIYRRTSEQILSLDEPNDRLRDPASTKSEQPTWAVQALRSRNPEWFVAIAVGTDLGCSVDYLPVSDTYFQQEIWEGGFVDSCRKALVLGRP